MFYKRSIYMHIEKKCCLKHYRHMCINAQHIVIANLWWSLHLSILALEVGSGKITVQTGLSFGILGSTAVQGYCQTHFLGKTMIATSMHGYLIVITVRPSFFFFCFTDFFRNKLVSEDEIKIKIKFNWKMVRMNFILPIKMAISHQVLSLGVILSTWQQ